MMKIISISNHKGGVGKTTSAVNIAAGLNISGKKVLVIDLDAQSSLSQSFGMAGWSDFDIYGSLSGKYDLKPVNIMEGFDLIPSHIDLAAAEFELSAQPGREFILKELLEPFLDSYDYCIIDCPPAIGLLTINALTASDMVIIPVQAEFLAMRGLAKLYETIGMVQKRVNKELKIAGVLITQYDSRKILNKAVEIDIVKFFKEQVFKTRIRNNIALAEAPTVGQDIFRYQQKSNGATDYKNLCEEILKLNQNGK